MGADITNVATSLTLSADSGQNGHVWMLIDSEICDGDKSGTTVSNLARASEKYNGTASAASHTKGTSIYFIANFNAMQAAFVTKLDEAVLSGTTATVTFPNLISAIPTSFRNLQIVASCRGTSATNGNDLLAIQFNADSAANYHYEQQVFRGTAAVVPSEGLTQTTLQVGLVSGGGLADTALFAASDILIANYNSTTPKKQVVSRVIGVTGGATTNIQVYAMGGMWNSASAITSILLKPSTGSFATGTVLTLYGLP